MIDVSPAFLLQAGLPYSRSEMAIILDATLADVPRALPGGGARDAARERARRRGGPRRDRRSAPPRRGRSRTTRANAGCRVAVFATDDDVTARDSRRARAVGRVRDGRIIIEGCGDDEDCGPIDPALPRHRRRWRAALAARDAPHASCAPVRRKADAATPPHASTHRPHRTHDRDDARPARAHRRRLHPRRRGARLVHRPRARAPAGRSSASPPRRRTR